MKKEELRYEDSTLMEGMISFRAVIRGMESGVSRRRILRVLYDRSRERNLAGHLSYVRAMSYQHHFEVIPADPADIDALATGTSHGGILTVCSERTIPALSADAIPNRGFFVLIEGIEDPYNFGYALRSLYAAGVDGILLSPRNWMSAAGVVCRASAGASEQIPLYIAEGTDAADLFHRQGYRVLASDLDHSSPMWESDLTLPLLLIVGGERRGISRALLEKCDGVVRIDYGREFSAALSAASAATVLAFEVLRQNRG
ncbi:MAG: RNA methyltransferase [Clostridia bacterium]|nr:RNA methyltransferase [Clostridia bacterium]